MPATPFFDSAGIRVTADRRRIPDRRVGNIQVEWHDGGDGDRD
jgi:hypothetical protein